MLRGVGLLATESVEGEGLRAPKVRLWCGLAVACQEGSAVARNTLARLCSGTSGRPHTTLAGGRGKKMHFLGEQFQHQKMLPQRDFAAGGFSLAGAWKAATPGTTAEAQVPGNCWPIPGDGSGELCGHQPRWEILPSQPGSSGGDFLCLWLPSGRFSPPITPRYVFPSPWAPLEISPPQPLPKKLCAPILMAFVSLQRCLWREVQPTAQLLGEEKPAFSNRTSRLAQKRKVSGGVHLRRVSSQHRSGGKTSQGERRKEHRRKASIPIHWVHCREGAVRLWRRRFAACLMVGMTINFMCEGTSGSVSSILVIHLIGRFFFLLLAHRKWRELIIITIIVMITKIIITKVGDGKRVKGLFSCFSIGRKQGRKKQNQNQLHVGNS